MQPFGKIYLYKDGNDDKRIGDNKRNNHLPEYKNIELLLDNICPLSITCDVQSIQPPYFTEYNYCDMLSGINITTLSSEINARMAIAASETTTTNIFPIGEVMDKYELKNSSKKYNKIIFLVGSNGCNLIDQCKLQQLVHEDDEWVIKPHPVTNEKMLRDLGNLCGYHRVLDPKISGFSLLRNAKYIACLSTSEIWILARLLGIYVTDITRYDRSWLSAYQHITRLLDNTEQDYTKLNNILMSDLSGHLRLNYGENKCKELANNYFEYSLNLRENFKMVTNQKLIVADKSYTDWK